MARAKVVWCSCEWETDADKAEVMLREAIALLDEALDAGELAAGAQAGCLNIKGQCYMKLQEEAAALVAFKMALKLNSKFAQAREQLDLASKALAGQYARALLPSHLGPATAASQKPPPARTMNKALFTDHPPRRARRHKREQAARAKRRERLFCCYCVRRQPPHARHAMQRAMSLAQTVRSPPSLRPSPGAALCERAVQGPCGGSGRAGDGQSHGQLAREHCSYRRHTCLHAWWAVWVPKGRCFAPAHPMHACRCTRVGLATATSRAEGHAWCVQVLHTIAQGGHGEGHELDVRAPPPAVRFGWVAEPEPEVRCWRGGREKQRERERERERERPTERDTHRQTHSPRHTEVCVVPSPRAPLCSCRKSSTIPAMATSTPKSEPSSASQPPTLPSPPIPWRAPMSLRRRSRVEAQVANW